MIGIMATKPSSFIEVISLCNIKIWAGLLNRGHKMAAGARVIRDSDISVLPASGSVTC
jgi:hypothetical protein